jgi:acryloyl-coenzyme A reductase
MKAAVLRETGGPEALQLEDVPPPRPGPTEVVIKVAACGLCGHDQADRMGLTKVPLPATLGHEIAGVITEIGGRVGHFNIGDRVACKQFTTCGWCDLCRSGREMQCAKRHFNYGGYAEYAALEESAILSVPAEVDLVGASVVACTVGTCVRALKYIARVAPGETVVVTGTGGGLGLHGLQVARAYGARTIAITSSAQKIDEVRKWGADFVVLADGTEYWKDILEATGGRGAEVVLDNVGHPALFGPCYRALAREGRYVFTGQVARAKIELYPAFVFGKEAVITGSASTRMAEFVEAMDLVRRREVLPAVQQFPLAEIAHAYRRMDKREIFGRAVVVP